MTRSIRHELGGVIVLAVALLVAAPGTATAGCGCDHPPPEWSPVQPPFGSAGAEVLIWADGKAFNEGYAYEVEFDDRRIEGATVVATNPDYLRVTVPRGLQPGPASVRVFRGRTTHVHYSDHHFTALPKAVSVPNEDGFYQSLRFEVAVDRDGVVLLPIDLSMVLDATQFAFQFRDLRLTFDPDDVTFYNADGVDLSLFTLAVEDESQRQWGRYYGWEVEDEHRLRGMRYNNFVRRFWNNDSDILTYWRHEFHTYANAHSPGGSHEVGPDGRHPDGSLHIDHDHLVLAIHGWERHWLFPDHVYLAERLRQSRARVFLNLAVKRSENPVDPNVMLEMTKRRPASLEEAIEHMSIPVSAALSP